MLGLAEQVRRTDLGVDGIVGDHQCFCRSGEQVDANLAVELTLRLGNEGVAGTDQHVYRLDCVGAEAHGGHRLNAAENVDLVGAGHGHGGNGGGRRRAIQRRRAGDDPADAGHLGGQHAHVGGGDHGIAAARNVAADAFDRHVLVAKAHARDRLDFDLLHRRALGLGEAADLRLGEADIFDDLSGQAGDQCPQLVLGEPKTLGRPLVELDGELAHRDVSAPRDVFQDCLDCLADLAIAFGRLGTVAALLQIPDHRFPHPPPAAAINRRSSRHPPPETCRSPAPRHRTPDRRPRP